MNLKKAFVLPVAVACVFAMTGCASSGPQLPSQGADITSAEAAAKLNEVKSARSAKNATIDVSTGLFELSMDLKASSSGVSVSQTTHAVGSYDTTAKFAKFSIQTSVSGIEEAGSTSIDATEYLFVDGANTVMAYDGTVNGQSGQFYVAVPSVAMPWESPIADTLEFDNDDIDDLIDYLNATADPSASQYITATCKSNGGEGSVYVELKVINPENANQYAVTTVQFEKTQLVLVGAEMYESADAYMKSRVAVQFGVKVDTTKPDYTNWSALDLSALA